MYYVYFLKSTSRIRFYIGVTSDLTKRLKRHNQKRVKSTAPYTPWVIIHIESFTDIKEAYKREYYLKHPKGYLEKKNIIQNNSK